MDIYLFTRALKVEGPRVGLVAQWCGEDPVSFILRIFHLLAIASWSKDGCHSSKHNVFIWQCPKQERRRRWKKKKGFLPIQLWLFIKSENLLWIFPLSISTDWLELGHMLLLKINQWQKEAALPWLAQTNHCLLCEAGHVAVHKHLGSVIKEGKHVLSHLD